MDENTTKSACTCEYPCDGAPQAGHHPSCALNQPTAEMRELAGRMAADEASEGNFTAAQALTDFVEAEDPRFTCTRCGHAYPLVGLRLPAHDHPGTGRCPGSGTVPRLQGLVTEIGSPIECRGAGVVPAEQLRVVPMELVDEDRVTEGRAPIIDAMNAHVAEAIQRKLAIEEADATLQMSRFLAVIETERHLHGDEAAAGVAWCSVCRIPVVEGGMRVRADGIRRHEACDMPVQKLTPAHRDLEMMVQRLTTTPAFRTPEPPIVSRAAVESALSEDIEAVLGVPPRIFDQVALSMLVKGLIDRGWVPGARRRADAVDEVAKATHSDDRYEDQPIRANDGTLLGYIWEVSPGFPTSGDWIAALEPDDRRRPNFTARTDAESWVRDQARRQPGGGPR